MATYILDTETDRVVGGLTLARLCSLAITDEAGLTQFYSLINPGAPIPPEATAVHGITDQMVKDAPTFSDIAPEVFGLLAFQSVVCWNAAFDMHAMLYDAHRAGVVMPNDIEWVCAMLAYGEAFGSKTIMGEYKWWKLTTAYEVQYGTTTDLIDSAHNALGDCQMTAALWSALGEPETMVNSTTPTPIRFTHLERKFTKPGAEYASLTSRGGVCINVFDRQFEAAEKALGVDFKSWLSALAAKPIGYNHPLKSPLRIMVDFSRQYPEIAF